MSDAATNLPVAASPKREIQNVVDAVPILDTARFEHMQRIANVLARSSMIPETLRTVGKGDNKEPLPYEQVLSNCFLVVNQAARWGMDPFAVISCCAVVHGRLSYEGKLVAAVLDAKLGISLHHHFVGEPTAESYRIYLCDTPFTPELVELLKPGVKIAGYRLWDGSVAEWKTSGAGTPWTPKNFPRMLIYRGTRDWTRIYEPAVLLGVYTDDELLDLVEDARARRAQPVTSLADRLAASTAPRVNGFSQDHIERETRGGVIEESSTKAGDASQDETPQHATRHEQFDNVESAADAHGHPDRTENVGGFTDGGGHEVTETGEAPDQTSSPTESVSSEPIPQSPQSEVQATPATEASPLPQVAGNLSDEEESTLAVDWRDTYLTAMRRVNDRPKSLPTRHAEALQLIGGKANVSEQDWMKAVYRLTERRLKGEITPDDFTEAVREIA